MTVTPFLSLFSDYTFRTVALGVGMLGLVSGVVGCFCVLRKQSLMGDALSHCALPGVVGAFLLSGTKEMPLLLAGAFVCALLATLLISGITRLTRVKFDAALALVMSSFFGLGMVLLTYSQKIPNANQAGLKNYLFGQASTLLRRDIVLICACGLLLLVLVLLFFKELKLLCFDCDFSANAGFAPAKLSLLLSFMTVLTILIGLQAVGVILMSALLTAPAVAARQWVGSLRRMLILSAVFGAASGVAGAAASSLVPKLPTGPAIVVAASAITAVSLLFAPDRGVLHRAFKRRKNRVLYKLEGGAPHFPDA